MDESVKSVVGVFFFNDALLKSRQTRAKTSLSCPLFEKINKHLEREFAELSRNNAGSQKRREIREGIVSRHI